MEMKFLDESEIFIMQKFTLLGIQDCNTIGNNRRSSSSKRTSHMGMRFFLIVDQVDKDEVKIVCRVTFDCPSRKILNQQYKFYSSHRIVEDAQEFVGKGTLHMDTKIKSSK
jgi:hypothetical protein